MMSPMITPRIKPSSFWRHQPGADLFVQVANGAPEALHGRWALLYERVRLERSLWCEPTQTVDDIEAGAPVSEPYISLPKLRAAWPRLCAATFCV